jgi:hypothetical protein
MIGKKTTSADENAQPFELLKRHKPLKLSLNSLMIGENTNIVN